MSLLSSSSLHLRLLHTTFFLEKECFSRGLFVCSCLCFSHRHFLLSFFCVILWFFVFVSLLLRYLASDDITLSVGAGPLVGLPLLSLPCHVTIPYRTSTAILAIQHVLYLSLSPVLITSSILRHSFFDSFRPCLGSAAWCHWRRGVAEPYLWRRGWLGRRC